MDIKLKIAQRIKELRENKGLTREDFMNFFRDDEKLNQLTADDRVEVFRTGLIGSSDFTKELLNEILSDYCVCHLEIVEIKNCENNIIKSRLSHNSLSIHK
jgi:transcriptional regulator with XRE-family HTH domain